MNDDLFELLAGGALFALACIVGALCYRFGFIHTALALGFLFCVFCFPARPTVDEIELADVEELEREAAEWE